MSTVRDTATLNELRRLILRLERLEAQISQFVKNNTVITNHDTLQQLDYASSGHTGFASSSTLTAHTGDSTIHFTADSIGSRMLYVGANAAPPGANEPLWIVTDGGVFGNGSIRASLDGGSTYKETGIVFS